MKQFVFILLFTFLAACSSKDKPKELPERAVLDVKNEKIVKEYEVKDASSEYRPGWIEDAEQWARQQQKDLDKNRYFSFESDPKVLRSVACDIAKANVNADIASEVANFIEKSFSQSLEGAPSFNPNDPSNQSIKEYFSSSLSQKIQTMVNGAAIIKTYWEQRDYKKTLGSKEDYKSYTCAVLIRMEQDRLKKLVDNAVALSLKKFSDNKEMKEKVEAALKNVSENFIKSRQGEN